MQELQDTAATNYVSGLYTTDTDRLLNSAAFGWVRVGCKLAEAGGLRETHDRKEAFTGTFLIETLPSLLEQRLHGHGISDLAAMSNLGHKEAFAETFLIETLPSLLEQRSYGHGMGIPDSAMQLPNVGACHGPGRSW